MAGDTRRLGDKAEPSAMSLVGDVAEDNRSIYHRQQPSRFDWRFGAGPPPPVFDDVRAEARTWALFASPAEHKAYLAACWHHLSDRDRAAFVRAAKDAT